MLLFVYKLLHVVFTSCYNVLQVHVSSRSEVTFGNDVARHSAPQKPGRKTYYILLLCLIFHKLLGQNKGSNVKRHHETNHKNFSSKFPPKSELRKSKLTELKCALPRQQWFMKVFSKESDATTKAFFLVSWNITRSKHP